MRMLVTTPQYRAPLPEVMSHPWMTKGFDGAPDPHLIQREPLRLDELDRRVIEGMTGFEFGSADDVEGRLRDVLASDGYRVALADWEARKDGARNGRTAWKGQPVGTTPSSTSLGAMSTLSDSNFSDTSGSSPSKKSNKRFSGFDFYRKKLFSSSPKEEKSLASAMAGTNGHSSHVHSVTGIGSQQHEVAKEPLDPTRGYHPLISIYYLVREKMERERVYGPGHFASSELSMLPTSADIYAAQNAANSNGRASPGPHAAATSRPPVPDYSMPLPRLPTPASSVASPSSRAPGLSVDVPARTAATPRTRAGLDEPGLGDGNGVMQHPGADEASSRLATPTLPSSPVPNLPRAPGAASHRRSHSLSQNPTRPLSEAIPIPQSASAAQTMFPRTAEHPTARQVQAGISPPPRESNTLPALPPPIEDEENQEVLQAPRPTFDMDKPLVETPSLSSSPSGGSTFVKRFSSILSKAGGGPSGSPQQPQDKMVNKRQSLTLPRSFSRPTTAEKEKQLSSAIVAASPEADLAALPASQSAPMPGAGFHKRAATVLEAGPNGRRNHERRTSIGGSVARSATTSISSARRASGQAVRPSSIVGGPSPNAGGPGEWGMEAADERQEDGVKAANGAGGAKDSSAAAPEFKPLYAKGLFSVATTSTKSASALSEDIKRVLDRFGIQYRQIKGGFECVHTPSIDLSSVAAGESGGGALGAGGGSMRRKPSMKRKGSKLGLGGMLSTSTSKEKSAADGELQPPAPVGGSLAADGTSSGESSFLGAATLPLPAPTTTTDGTKQEPGATATAIVDPLSPPVSPKQGKAGGAALPRTPGPDEEGGNAWMFGGDGMSDMVVRFEVNVIKVSSFPPPSDLVPELRTDHVSCLAFSIQVPWLPLHGLQFRRAGGNGWQYQQLAKRILADLKL